MCLPPCVTTQGWRALCAKGRINVIPACVFTADRRTVLPSPPTVKPPGRTSVSFGGVHMKRRGFTLIELLVVVAIIALLIAILLPSLGKAKELSNRSVCAANVRGIMQSMVVYSADNNESYPYLGPSNVASANKTPVGNTVGGIMNDVFYLVGSGSVAPKQFVCKSDNYAQASSSPASSTNNNGVPGYAPTYWANGGDANLSYSYSFAF